MKYVRVLGLLALAATALMAFAATASAELTRPTNVTLLKGAAIHAVNESTHVTLDPPSLPAIECNSTVQGSVAVDAGTSGSISTLSFTGCTSSWHVTTVSGGELEIEATGGYNGVVYSKGATVEATRFGVTCRYATANTTEVGIFTGGDPGTMHITADIPFHSGSGLCGTDPTAWEGDYVTTGELYVDN